MNTKKYLIKYTIFDKIGGSNTLDNTFPIRIHIYSENLLKKKLDERISKNSSIKDLKDFLYEKYKINANKIILRNTNGRKHLDRLNVKFIDYNINISGQNVINLDVIIVKENQDLTIPKLLDAASGNTDLARKEMTGFTEFRDVLNTVNIDQHSRLILNVRSKGDHNKTFIHYTARNADDTLLLFIKKKIGEDNFKILVNVNDNEVRTPLMLLCRNGGNAVDAPDFKEKQINVANILLKYMSDENKTTKDKNGNSALKYAINNDVDGKLAEIIYNASIPSIEDFISDFFNTGNGIKKLITRKNKYFLKKFIIHYLNDKLVIEGHLTKYEFELLAKLKIQYKL